MEKDVVMNEEILGHVKDFEELQKQMKAKKQALKKAVFFAKHPSLRVKSAAASETKPAVSDVKPVAVQESRDKQSDIEKFNQSITQASVAEKPVAEKILNVKPIPKSSDLNVTAEIKPIPSSVAEPVRAVAGRWF